MACFIFSLKQRDLALISLSYKNANTYKGREKLCWSAIQHIESLNVFAAHIKSINENMFA